MFPPIPLFVSGVCWLRLNTTFKPYTFVTLRELLCASGNSVIVDGETAGKLNWSCPFKVDQVKRNGRGRAGQTADRRVAIQTD